MVRGVRLSQDPEVKGWCASHWVKVYAGTHHEGKRIEWPDGGSYLTQPAVVVEAFGIIGEEFARRRAELSREERKHGKRQRR